MRGRVASSILQHHQGSSSAAAVWPMLQTATKASLNSIASNQCTMRTLMSTATTKMLRRMTIVDNNTHDMTHVCLFQPTSVEGQDV
eukprot:14239471-Ditylum_brightwellii.AAC.1